LKGLWYDVQGAEPSAAGRAAVVLRAAVARTALAFVAERRHTRDALVRDAIVSSSVEIAKEGRGGLWKGELVDREFDGEVVRSFGRFCRKFWIGSVVPEAANLGESS
jgi:hypothetical protein